MDVMFSSDIFKSVGVFCLPLFHIIVDLLHQWAKQCCEVNELACAQAEATHSTVIWLTQLFRISLSRSSPCPVIAEEDLEAVEEGVFDIHL